MRRLTTEIFIERAKAKHGDKYDYSKVEYKGIYDRVCIICLEHGEFWQSPNDHINNGHGCPLCGQESRRISQFLSTNEFVERAKKVHAGKYTYDGVNYIRAKSKVLIHCNRCGNNFWQTPSDHLQGKGCPECKRVLFLGPNKSTEDFIYEALNIHGDKYDYSKVNYLGWNKKVLIHCNNCGNDFLQTPNNHLRGKGCPKCAHIDSTYEEYLNTKLNVIFGKENVAREYNKDKRYPFHCDFYIKSRDLFIEVNGFWAHNDHWFDENNEDDIKQVNEWKYKNTAFYDSAIGTWTVSDVNKREYARKNNLNYVVLWNKKDIKKWIDDGCPIRKDWK